MSLRKANYLAGAAIAAVALVPAGKATAQVACESLPSPVYMIGSSASQPIWNEIGPLLSAAGMSLVYQNPGSCNGVQDIESNQGGTPTTLKNGSSTYWFNDGGIGSCTSTNDTVDIGISDVFQSTCDIVLGAVGPSIGAFNAPTQVMTYIRPIDANNNQMPNEISAEQAHFVFGTQMGDGIAPWDQPTQNITANDAGTPFLFIRNAQSGTQSMIGQAILLDPLSFLGVNAGGTGTVISDVNAAGGMANDQSVMGIAVAGLGYDSKRSEVQALAFRGFEQAAAWLPDSTVASFDKRNVRAGLYTVFGPLQILFNTDGTGTDISHATDQAAITLVNYLNGTTAVPGTSTTITQFEIGASMIPDCAMGVTRFDTASVGGNAEGAIVANTSRAHSCDCYFESQVTSSTVTCKSCTGASDCAGTGLPVCGENGVCEAF